MLDVMDRRLFLLSSIAGFTDPVSPLLAPAGQPAPVTTSGDPRFDAWSQSFVARAVAAGWPEDLLRRELKDLTPDPGVLEADVRQPEFSRSTGDYMKGAVSASRIATGQAKLVGLGSWLSLIEARYGVDRTILVAIWAMESGFGAVQGDHDVIRALASLAADGRRRAWAEAELFAALRIIATGKATREQLKGSWAGAMGQTQFTPVSYVSRAVDIDGDARPDIWGSAPDALGSAANLLHEAGWRTGESWTREVRAPVGFDYGVTEGPAQPTAWWDAHGVARVDGAGWSAADAASSASLIAPAGAGGPLFLVFPNHFVIRKYNNSTRYALAVGLLADGIGGAPGVSIPWPVEAPLSREQRVAAQIALNALGFAAGEPDGVVGTGSRAALRRWQAARGLTADGFLTPDLAERLRAEAAEVATTGVVQGSSAGR